MNNEIKEIQNKLDDLFFQNALNEVWLKTLEETIFKLAARLLTKDELSNLWKDFRHAHLRESHQKIYDLQGNDVLYHPYRLSSELFDLQCRLRNFEKQNNLRD